MVRATFMASICERKLLYLASSLEYYMQPQWIKSLLVLSIVMSNYKFKEFSCLCRFFKFPFFLSISWGFLLALNYGYTGVSLCGGRPVYEFRYSQTTEDSTGVTDGWDPPEMVVGNWIQILLKKKKHPALVSDEPSLLLHLPYVKCSRWCIPVYTFLITWVSFPLMFNFRWKVYVEVYVQILFKWNKWDLTCNNLRLIHFILINKNKSSDECL